MSGLDRIGVRVEMTGGANGASTTVQNSAGNGAAAGPGAAGTGAAGLGGGVNALAFEIAGLLERLAAGGDPGTIDLRSLPMTADDLVRLRELLGPGEVQAVIDADGQSIIRETGINGVWWSEYRDPHGDLLAEVIEICNVPDILVSDLDLLPAAAARLRARVESCTAIHP